MTDHLINNFGINRGDFKFIMNFEDQEENLKKTIAKILSATSALQLPLFTAVKAIDYLVAMISGQQITTETDVEQASAKYNQATMIIARMLRAVVPGPCTSPPRSEDLGQKTLGKEDTIIMEIKPTSLESMTSEVFGNNNYLSDKGRTLLIAKCSQFNIIVQEVKKKRTMYIFDQHNNCQKSNFSYVLEDSVVPLSIHPLQKDGKLKNATCPNVLLILRNEATLKTIVRIVIPKEKRYKDLLFGHSAPLASAKVLKLKFHDRENKFSMMANLGNGRMYYGCYSLNNENFYTTLRNNHQLFTLYLGKMAESREIVDFCFDSSPQVSRSDRQLVAFLTKRQAVYTVILGRIAFDIEANRYTLDKLREFQFSNQNTTLNSIALYSEIKAIVLTGVMSLSKDPTQLAVYTEKLSIFENEETEQSSIFKTGINCCFPLPCTSRILKENLKEPSLESQMERIEKFRENIKLMVQTDDQTARPSSFILAEKEQKITQASLGEYQFELSDLDFSIEHQNKKKGSNTKTSLDYKPVAAFSVIEKEWRTSAVPVSELVLATSGGLIMRAAVPNCCLYQQSQSSLLSSKTSSPRIDRERSAEDTRHRSSSSKPQEREDKKGQTAIVSCSTQSSPMAVEDLHDTSTALGPAEVLSR